MFQKLKINREKQTLSIGWYRQSSRAFYCVLLSVRWFGLVRGTQRIIRIHYLEFIVPKMERETESVIGPASLSGLARARSHFLSHGQWSNFQNHVNEWLNSSNLCVGVFDAAIVLSIRRIAFLFKHQKFTIECIRNRVATAISGVLHYPSHLNLLHVRHRYRRPWHHHPLLFGRLFVQWRSVAAKRENRNSCASPPRHSKKIFSMLFCHFFFFFDCIGYSLSVDPKRTVSRWIKLIFSRTQLMQPNWCVDH